MQKKIVLISLISVICVSSILGQRISIGLSGDLITSAEIKDLSSIASIDNSINSITGYGITAFGEYHFTKKISTSIGVSFGSQIGVKREFMDLPFPNDWAIYYNGNTPPQNLYSYYKNELAFKDLKVPVLFNLYIPMSETRRDYNTSRNSLFLSFGPFAKFMLNATRSRSGLGIIYEDEEMKSALPVEAHAIDYSEKYLTFQSINWGLSSAVGYLANFNKENAMFLKVCYDLTLSDLQKNYSNENFSSFYFSIGYTYTIQTSFKKIYKQKKFNRNIYRRTL